ncbi:MAG: 50S rRNA methyltransferase, partial [candidate division SR1 bacterium]
HKAKKEGYQARSIFKLEEIQNKFNIFSKDTKKIVDIGCAPGSWLQYTNKLLNKLRVPYYELIGFDIKTMEIQIPNTTTYQQDITEQEKVAEILNQHNFDQIDLIQSDMAPNTIGMQDIDAIRSFALLEETLRIYKTKLAPNGKFVIKVFMGPGFEEFVADLKQHFGSKSIKIFKPKSCRSESKEIYIVKI